VRANGVLQVNALSIEMAKLAAMIEDRQASLPAGQQATTDSEEFRLRGDLKALKLRYRGLADDFATAKACLEPSAAAVREARRQLLEDFESWYSVEGTLLNQVCYFERRQGLRLEYEG
jgi:hypothetical protein